MTTLETVTEACLAHPLNGVVETIFAMMDGEPDDHLAMQVLAKDPSHMLMVTTALRRSKGVATATERRLQQAGREDVIVLPGLGDSEENPKKAEWKDPAEKYRQDMASVTTEAERHGTILKSVAILNRLPKKSVVIFLLTVADDLMEMIKAGLQPDKIKAVYAQGGELASGAMGFNWVKSKEAIQFVIPWLQTHEIPMYLLTNAVYSSLKLYGETAFPGGSLTEMDHPALFEAFRQSKNKGLGEILDHAAAWGRHVGVSLPVVRDRTGKAYLEKQGKELTPEAIETTGRFVLEKGICMADVLVALLTVLKSFIAERVTYTFEGDKAAWKHDPTSMIYAVRDLDVKACIAFLYSLA